MLDRFFDALTHSDLVKSVISPTVAIFLFILTQIVQIVFKRLDLRNERKRIIIGIYKEISENLAYNIKLLDQLSIIGLIKARIIYDSRSADAEKRTPTYRPLIAITQSSKFYDAVASALPTLEVATMVRISSYYKPVNDQKIVAETIASYAFLHISTQSRCETIDELWEAFRESHFKGLVAVEFIAKTYPASWFRDLNLDDIADHRSLHADPPR